MLFEPGRRADALPPAQETVAIYRELAAASPDRHRSGLSIALANLAEVHEALDQHADAEGSM
jgi:hypothetical protein